MTVTQSAFTQALLDPDAQTPTGLIDPNGAPAGKRFDVYRNNVIVSLIDAMETAFPVIHKLLGQQNFRNLASLYVRTHPPVSPMLMFYGGMFPTFLDGFEPLSHLPYLADVARLELARRTSYHAKDTTSVSIDAIASISPEKLMQTRFTIAPAAELLTSAFPIVDIWNFNMIDGAAKPKPVAQTALISRPEMDVEMRIVSEPNATFIRDLQTGVTLGQAYENAASETTEFDLSSAIVLMLDAEIITKTNS